MKNISENSRNLSPKKSAKQSEKYSQDAKREEKTFVLSQVRLYCLWKQASEMSKLIKLHGFDCISKETCRSGVQNRLFVEICLTCKKILYHLEKSNQLSAETLNNWTITRERFNLMPKFKGDNSEPCKCPICIIVSDRRINLNIRD